MCSSFEGKWWAVQGSVTAAVRNGPCYDQVCVASACAVALADPPYSVGATCSSNPFEFTEFSWWAVQGSNL